MTILILIIGISLLILVHELGHFLAAKWFGLLVEEFGFGFPPRLWRRKVGETVYSINALPFGGFVKIYGEQAGAAEGELAARSFSRQSVSRRAIIIAAGVIMNVFMGWLLLSGLYLVGSGQGAIVINEIAPGSPAAEAKLLPGDILAEFRTGKNLLSFVQSSQGNPAPFLVQRGGERFTVTMVPRENPPAGEGALGIAFSEAGIPRYPFPQNFTKAFADSFYIIGQVFRALGTMVARIVTGGPVLRDLTGPVGIFQVANQAAEFGFAWLVHLIALISLNLAALNIFPFPALDGGRLLFLAIEKVRGAALSPKKENLANAVGFALLIALMVAVTVKDVAGLF